MDRYRTLDAAKVVATLRKLDTRIRERFPEAGLARVSAELVSIGVRTRARADAIARPNLLLRALVVLLLLAGLGMLALVGTLVEVKRDADNLYGVMQGIDAFINILIVTGAGLFFLATVEERVKRRAALSELHELRSIVHVVDMHQLTKDPSRILRPGSRTHSSPTETLSPFELERYLDYCSEMLSLVAKLAAIYAQSSPDAVVINAVNDIEQLAGGLSQKIWQKIMILDRVASAVGAISGDPGRATSEAAPQDDGAMAAEAS
ncbi:MAG: hypothetical protein R3D33_00725 [Hyphomicrobiaceae bacterium]